MVSIRECKAYEETEAALALALEDLGGIGRFVRPGDRVLVKPNLLMKTTPDTATLTHPSVVRAVCRAVLEAGGEVTIADSPGGLYSEHLLRQLYAASGMKEIADELGVTLNYGTGFGHRSYPEGKVGRQFDIIDPILQADKVISVAKLKTHTFARYTGAVKNLFGAIPGTYKAECHLRMPDVNVFCSYLVDLCECIAPTLSVIDGIVGMEGQGPSGGTPRFIGALIASDNPHEADVAACRMIGYTPEEIPTLAAAMERGLLDNYEEKGDGTERFVIKDYRLMPKQTQSPIFRMMPRLGKWLSPRPSLYGKDCVGCGICARHCPAKAITMKNKKPEIDRTKCFRCFCCQELCPEHAMRLRRATFWLR